MGSGKGQAKRINAVSRHNAAMNSRTKNTHQGIINDPDTINTLLHHHKYDHPWREGIEIYQAYVIKNNTEEEKEALAALGKSLRTKSTSDESKGHMEKSFFKKKYVPAKHMSYHKDLMNDAGEFLSTGDEQMDNILYAQHYIAYEYVMENALKTPYLVAHNLAVANHIGGQYERLNNANAYEEGAKEYEDNKDGWDVLVKNNYNITQDFLNEKQIKQISAYRYDEPSKNNADFSYGPLVSVSINVKGMDYYVYEFGGNTLEKSISVLDVESKDIYAVSAGTFGVSTEGEVIILNRNNKIKHNPSMSMNELLKVGE